MARTAKPDVINPTFAEDQPILEMLAALRRKNGEPGLSFSSCADKRVLHEMEIEIARRIVLAASASSIGSVGVFFHRTALTSPISALVVDVPAIRREVGRRKKEYPHSISRGVVFPTMVGSELGLSIGIASLVMSRDAEDVPRMTAPASAAAVSLPPDQWEAHPDSNAISRMVAAFQAANVDVRKLASRSARLQDQEQWASLRLEAAIALRIADILSPVKKMYAAVGHGSEILNHALTGPEARAKRVGKNGLNREEVAHRFWCHALTNHRNPPPFVKI